mmetsp:Transcript_3494/g.10839  ORF Transcript_3494/g.10839 Transcript_3494/m.10839 type:complete len:236 (-) Transcript_3494:670-1377(-)
MTLRCPWRVLVSFSAAATAFSSSLILPFFCAADCLSRASSVSFTSSLLSESALLATAASTRAFSWPSASTDETTLLVRLATSPWMTLRLLTMRSLSSFTAWMPCSILATSSCMAGMRFFRPAFEACVASTMEERSLFCAMRAAMRSASWAFSLCASTILSVILLTSPVMMFRCFSRASRSFCTISASSSSFLAALSAAASLFVTSMLSVFMVLLMLSTCTWYSHCAISSSSVACS